MANVGCVCPSHLGQRMSTNDLISGFGRPVHNYSSHPEGSEPLYMWIGVIRTLGSMMGWLEQDVCDVGYHIYGMCKVGCCGPRKEGEDKDEEDMVMRMKTPTTLCLLALRLRRHTSGAPPVTQRMHAGSARPGAAQRSPLSTAHNISYIHVSSQKDVPYIQPVHTSIHRTESGHIRRRHWRCAESFQTTCPKLQSHTLRNTA